MGIKLYNPSNDWESSIPDLGRFNIVPEIRAYGTISKGYSDGNKGYPTKADHFIVHFDAECRVATKTDERLLKSYGISSDKFLKTIHVGIITPSFSFRVGRFKFGRGSGVICASDDNIQGKPLMDMVAGNRKILEQGVFTECKSCEYNLDGTCSETLLVFFTINSKSETEPSPFLPTQLFKMTIPRTARNSFFGDLTIAMQAAYSIVSTYGCQSFPQSMIPFQLSLIKRNGQYYDERKRSQVKTTYYVPVIELDHSRMIERLEKHMEKMGMAIEFNQTKQIEMVDQSPMVETENEKEPEIIDIKPDKSTEYVRSDPKNDIISKDNHKHLEALIKEHGLKDHRERIKAYCENKFGVSHFTELTIGQYEFLIAKLPEFSKKIKSESEKAVEDLPFESEPEQDQEPETNNGVPF